MAEETIRLFHAIIDLATGKAVGVATFMRIDRAHGVIEVGNINYSPLLQRTPRRHRGHVPDDGAACSTSSATAATSGSAIPSTRRRARRRCGWASSTRACSGRRSSTRAATATPTWFSIIDSEWPALKRAYEQWLAPANFDAEGRQTRGLRELIAAGR